MMLFPAIPIGGLPGIPYSALPSYGVPGWFSASSRIDTSGLWNNRSECTNKHLSESGGSFGNLVDPFFTLNDLSIAKDGSNYSKIFIRFSNLLIPQGAIILSSKLVLTINGVSVNCTCNVSINDTSNSVAPIDFASADSLVLSTPIHWNLLSTDSSTYPCYINVSSLVQTIVSKSAWLPGNAITLVVDCLDVLISAEPVNVIFEGISIPSLKPRLVVNYSLGALISSVSEDAGYWDNSSNFDNIGDTIDIGDDIGDKKSAFLRFPVDIPRGTIIHHAALRLSILNDGFNMSLSAYSAGYSTAYAISATDGSAWSWGSNAYGQIGDNTIINKSSPISVVGGFSFSKINSKYWHVAGINGLDGSAWMWGLGNDGELGNDTKSNSSSPISVLGGFSWSQISCGEEHTLAINGLDGSAWTWGNGSKGKLGVGDVISYSSPVSVLGGFSWRKLACGYSHSVGIRGDGTAWAWGNGASGILGTGTTASYSSPVSVLGEIIFRDIDANYNFTIGIRESDGTAWAWGYNGFGQLGDLTKTLRSSPVSVVGHISFTKISAGEYSVLAIDGSGGSWGWGYNTYYQLGDGTYWNQSSPVSGISGLLYTDMGAGSTFSGGLSGGNAWSVGYNGTGVIGDGTTTQREVPFRAGTQPMSNTSGHITIGVVAPADVSSPISQTEADDMVSDNPVLNAPATIVSWNIDRQYYIDGDEYGLVYNDLTSSIDKIVSHWSWNRNLMITIENPSVINLFDLVSLSLKSCYSNRYSIVSDKPVLELHYLSKPSGILELDCTEAEGSTVWEDSYQGLYPVVSTNCRINESSTYPSAGKSIRLGTLGDIDDYGEFSYLLTRLGSEFIYECDFMYDVFGPCHIVKLDVDELDTLLSNACVHIRFVTGGSDQLFILVRDNNNTTIHSQYYSNPFSANIKYHVNVSITETSVSIRINSVEYGPWLITAGSLSGISTYGSIAGVHP